MEVPWGDREWSFFLECHSQSNQSGNTIKQSNEVENKPFHRVDKVNTQSKQKQLKFSWWVFDNLELIIFSKKKKSNRGRDDRHEEDQEPSFSHEVSKLRCIPQN